VAYDGFLLLSFGGPEGPDDVMPFLENVVRGRGVPRDRLLEVAEHYQHFDGISPINGANRDLLDRIRAEFRDHGIGLPVYWGNRNWHPFVEDTVATMAADGVTNALVFATSAYSGYSACRQYWEDLDRARAAVGAGAPQLHKLRHFFDHPGFVEPLVDSVRGAVASLAAVGVADPRLVFTAHSVPLAMAARSGPEALERELAPDEGLYVRELAAAAQLVAERAAPMLGWDLVWQSRSGPPHVPWLEPDINDHLRALAADGVAAVVAVPIGFVSDHVEVIWDLDHEAAHTASQVGIKLCRTVTPGHDDRFSAMVRELVQERLDPPAPRRALSALGPMHDVCPLGCCPSGRPAAR
jgi:ferrochelatase